MIPKIPWSIGFTMKGTVSNVAMANDRIKFKFKGWFSFHQIADGTNHVIKLNCERGISATITPTSFVAVIPSGGAAAVQNNKGRLLEILEAAAEKNRSLTIDLLNPEMDFSEHGISITLRDAKVAHITDYDLH